MSGLKVGIAAVGVTAHGIDNWSAAQQLLASNTAYDERLPLAKLAPSMLPANERRRTTKLIKIALQCGQDVLDQWSGDVNELATVFASSGGDLEIVDRILNALCMEGKPVSPTHFHNSVHNAPAGYWSIAAKARAASTSISAYDSSFVAGLLEASTTVACDGKPVLMVAYDCPPPPTLMPFRPLVAPFATALLLVPTDSADVQAQLTLNIRVDRENKMADEALENLRTGNPAARALPLLQQLASQKAGTVVLPYLSGQAVSAEVVPC
ncbi:beta-ketoacyl synthase chain length factor [Pseudomonadota bacterium]